MGERWGSDSLISYIELGSLGHWGEWHVLIRGRNSQIAVGRSKGAVCEGMAGGISECDDPDAQTILFCKKLWIWSVQ